jgi:hypothetical protein
MKKKQAKIKIIKTAQNGFPKDITAVAAETIATNEPNTRDSRLPAVGTVITKKYKGEELNVKVIENSFEYKGRIFKSISALAVHIVGAPISGYVFFKLGAKNE